MTQKQLAQVIGDEGTILPLDAETGVQLYVWSCWEEEPTTLGKLLEMTWGDEGALRAEWLCGDGEVPRKVGTPAEAVAPSSD